MEALFFCKNVNKGLTIVIKHKRSTQNGKNEQYVVNLM